MKEVRLDFGGYNRPTKADEIWTIWRAETRSDSSVRANLHGSFHVDSFYARICSTNGRKQRLNNE